MITINQNKDFRRSYYRGKSYVDSALVVYVLKTRAGFCRFGITAGKKLGTAVNRNRAKRLIRESLRNALPEFADISADIVVVARSRILRLKSGQVSEILKRKFNEAGILKK